MGGAFVAVADDSTATWWNPAALAAGPFLDIALGAAASDIDGNLPAHRERSRWFALAIPPFGLSYYRLRVTDIGDLRTIGPDVGSREDRRAAVPDWSLSASQFGATLVHSLVSGIHVGTTLKYVRAEGLSAEVAGAATSTVPEWLALADDVSGGDVHHNFDLDVGVLAVRGPLRVGGLVRNVRETDLVVARVPRQARVGIAFDASPGAARPLILALDADVLAYDTRFGERRVVAIGAEGWAFGRRLGVRAGARFNTVGAEERAFTSGASVALRAGMFVDGYLTYGGADDESGWGIAARASF